MTVAEAQQVSWRLSPEETQVLVWLVTWGGHCSALSLPPGLHEVVWGMVAEIMPLVEWRKSQTEVWLSAVGQAVVATWGE